MCGALEIDHLTRKVIDPPGYPGITLEQLVFDFVNVVFESGDNGTIFVDNLVENGVEHCFRSQTQ